MHRPSSRRSYRPRHAVPRCPAAIALLGYMHHAEPGGHSGNIPQPHVPRETAQLRRVIETDGSAKVTDATLVREMVAASCSMSS